MTQQSKIVLLGIIGLVVSGFVVGRLLVEFDWNPTTTIKFGEAFPEQNDYAEDLLGPLVLTPQAGHDGKFYFSQAMDPFYLEPEVHAVYLDRPTYRAQRMLYPTLAGLGGVLPPTETAWSLIVVNVLAMAVGTAVTAMVAVELGLSPWWGLAFLFNPGLLVTLNIDSAEIVAMAALMAAILFAIRDRPTATAIALTAAALTRETMILAAIGLALFWYKKRSRFPLVLLTPFAAVAAWWVYVHWRLSDGLSQDIQAIGWPLQGFIQAFGGWLSTPNSLSDALIGCVLLFASVAIAVRAIRTPSPLGWAVAGFAALALVLSEPVWARYFDSSRALAPVLTAYILLVLSSSKDRTKVEHRPIDEGARSA
jgi:hypothetical protein